MPWLIEAYRTQHGPSFAREVLTVAAGTYPDANDISVYVSYWDHDAEVVGWRDVESGEAILGESERSFRFAAQLDKWAEEKLGVWPDDEKATYWSRHEVDAWKKHEECRKAGICDHEEES